MRTFRADGARDMSIDCITLSLAGWAPGLVFVPALTRMASDQDRHARHTEKRLAPFSEVTITHIGNG